MKKFAFENNKDEFGRPENIVFVGHSLIGNILHGNEAYGKTVWINGHKDRWLNKLKNNNKDLYTLEKTYTDRIYKEEEVLDKELVGHFLLPPS